MKKFYSLAYIAAMFLLGCSADGQITDSGDVNNPPAINWSKDGQVACIIVSPICSYMKKEACESTGGTTLPSCPAMPTPTSMYCSYPAGYEYENDCDLIGGEYIANEDMCREIGGTPRTLQWCQDNDKEIYNE